jgi:hypothetical protein
LVEDLPGHKNKALEVSKSSASLITRHEWLCRYRKITVVADANPSLKRACLNRAITFMENLHPWHCPGIF